MSEVDAHAFCREVEAHLCRQNGGHLIRVVGPAFDVVKAWADDGIPLSVALAGIDRTVARAARRPGRRRPVRVEFCDDDVRDGYDQWRIAVGAGAARPGAARPPREPLRQHIERVVLQLTTASGSGRVPDALTPAVKAAAAAVDELYASSLGARGAARDRILETLARLDERLMEAALASLSAEDRMQIARDAQGELAPFRERLDGATWTRAVAAASARLVRQRLNLPVVTFE